MSIPSPWGRDAMDRFLADFLYQPEAFLIDEVIREDRPGGVIEARMGPGEALPVARYQRGDPSRHPRHVSGPDLILLTGNLGCLSAYFFHGCRWEEGWVGFGSRIHRADFKRLARIDRPLELRSRETRTRRGERRVVIRFEFEFAQDGLPVYFGDQSAMFLKDVPFEEE